MNKKSLSKEIARKKPYDIRQGRKTPSPRQAAILHHLPKRKNNPKPEDKTQYSQEEEDEEEGRLEEKSQKTGEN